MESVNGIHNTGGNLRHDKPLHTLRGRTIQSKPGDWSKKSTGKSMKLYEKLWMLIFREE